MESRAQEARLSSESIGESETVAVFAIILGEGACVIFTVPYSRYTITVTGFHFTRYETLVFCLSPSNEAHYIQLQFLMFLDDTRLSAVASVAST